MLVNRKAPHGTIFGLEALEVALVAGAFDQDVSLVFADDGVYQLVKGQDTESIGLKNFAKAFRALEDYDIRKLFVEQESMLARGLKVDDLMVPAEMIDAKRIGELMEQQDVVLSF
ncbi:MAG: sulfurtransferase complex subunit TusC [Pseudomonadota bacterium]|nr:sulfurtransferase complex subunit TusC [Pseudomonadota bacterium]